MLIYIIQEITGNSSVIKGAFLSEHNAIKIARQLFKDQSVALSHDYRVIRCIVGELNSIHVVYSSEEDDEIPW